MLNNYQKSILSWGALVFIGYLITQYVTDLNLLLISWVGVSIFGILLQYLFMKNSSITLQIFWGFLVTIGLIYTYLTQNGIVIPSVYIDINAYWFGLIGVGMIITGIKTRTYYYFLLAIIYFGLSFMFQNMIFNFVYIIAGSAFLLLCFADAIMSVKLTKRF